MRRRPRTLALLLILGLIVAFRLGQAVYRWYAFGEERAELGRLEEELETAGVGVIATQLRADTIRRALEEVDSALHSAREALSRSDYRQLLPGQNARSFGEVAAYNTRIEERNALLRDWRGTVNENHVFVDRYNALVDSIKGLANRIGEPYYPILSPAEIASRRSAEGLTP